MGEPIPASKLSIALVAVAKCGNIVGQVFEDKVVNFKDVGVIVAGLGSLTGLLNIDLSGCVDEAGKLTESARAQAVQAFKVAFDISDDDTEAFAEESLDACATALLAFVKAKGALAKLQPKLKAA